MGNKNCERVQTNLLSNQAYGQFEIVKEGQDSYAKIIKVLQFKDDIQKSIAASLSIRRQINIDGLCALQSYVISQEQPFLHIVVKYEYIATSLHEKKQQIFNKNEYFSQVELIKIIDTVSRTLRQMYKNKIKHGCINMNTILCNQNDYKLTDVSTTTNLTNLELILKGAKNQPVSKKIIEINNQSRINYFAFKQVITLEDDLFSLGILILSLATKTEVSYFYKITEIQRKFHIQFRDDIMDDYLYILRKRYNKKLQKIVRKLCYQSRISPQISIISKSNDIQTHPNSNISMQISHRY